MKKQVKSIFFCWCVVSIFNTLPLAAQEAIEPEIAFKMHIFLADITYLGMPGEYNIMRDTVFVKKYQTFKDFYDSTTLLVDTLKCFSLVSGDFSFFRVRKICFHKSYECPLELRCFSDESRFVLAIDQRNSVVYRLGGFVENDFFHLLANVKARKNISTRYFLRNAHVESLDFNCLHKGLHDSKRKAWDVKKYPCLAPSKELLFIPCAPPRWSWSWIKYKLRALSGKSNW